MNTAKRSKICRPLINLEKTTGPSKNSSLLDNMNALKTPNECTVASLGTPPVDASTAIDRIAEDNADDKVNDVALFVAGCYDTPRSRAGFEPGTATGVDPSTYRGFTSVFNMVNHAQMSGGTVVIRSLTPFVYAQNGDVLA